MGNEEERELTFYQYLPGTTVLGTWYTQHLISLLRFNHPVGFPFYHGFKDLGKSLKAFILPYTLYMRINLPNKFIA